MADALSFLIFTGGIVVLILGVITALRMVAGESFKEIWLGVK